MPEVYFPGNSESRTVGSIFCIGRNYAEHAAELNNPIPKEPLVFLKPASALISSGDAIVLPARSNSVHHEVEVVALIGQIARNIDADEALKIVDGYAVGIDITARDIQSQAKEKGHPWSVAKGFDTFAPVSPFVAASQIPDPQSMELSLVINGETRQQGNTRDMLFPVSRLIEFLSSVFTLHPGDLIFTGTPGGVGPLVDGDTLTATLGNGLTTLHSKVFRHK